jgi:two-component system, cell cycle response regulator
MIKWNDSLNIGVESIDNDHKKLLIIINKFFNEKNLNNYEKIFDELEAYAKLHFDGEEALIKKCEYKDYDEHCKQHQILFDEVAKLKKKVLHANNIDSIKEVSDFLINWLNQHIINEDMQLIDNFKAFGIIKENRVKVSRFECIIKTINHRIGFSGKMFITAIVPLSGLLLFGFLNLWNNYSEYTNVKNISEITHTIHDLNELSHLLQIERGLSSGYLSSKDNKFHTPLLNKRIEIDMVINLFLKNLQKVDSNNHPFLVKFMIKLKQDTIALTQIRDKIDNKSVSKSEGIAFYKKMIENIILITSEISFLNDNQEISHILSSLSSMIYMKELLGQERAFGTFFIEQRHMNKQDNQAYIKLLGQQTTYVDLINRTADIKTKASIKDFFNSPTAKKIEAYKIKMINYEYTNLESSYWFHITTKHIDSLKEIIEFHIEKMHDLVESHVANTLYQLITWLGYTLIILFLTIITAYTLDKSISFQIEHLLKRMKSLSEGEREILYNYKDGSDIISKIYSAYEIIRRALLKGDLLSELYFEQERINLDQQKKMNTKLLQEVIHDGLTGLFNRRYYDQMIQKELLRAQREHHYFTFVMLDVDHFKLYNDTYGHSEGDKTLKAIANVLQQKLVRAGDFVFRLGGEEFGFFFTGDTPKEAMQHTEMICKSIEALHIKHAKNSVSSYVTASFGLVNIDFNTTSMNEHLLYIAADNALYQAKESGRNRVVQYEPEQN